MAITTMLTWNLCCLLLTVLASSAHGACRKGEQTSRDHACFDSDNIINAMEKVVDKGAQPLIPIDYLARIERNESVSADPQPVPSLRKRSLQSGTGTPDDIRWDLDREEVDPNATHIRDPNAPTNNYFIPNPEIFFCDFSASFVMRFDVSDYLLESQFLIEMMAKDEDNKCTVDITNNTYLSPGLAFDETPLGEGLRYRQVAYYLEADSKLIPLSPVLITPEEQGDPTADPYINFCTKMFLYDRDGMLVNWIETEFFLYYKLDKQGFFDDRRRLLLNRLEETKDQGFSLLKEPEMNYVLDEPTLLEPQHTVSHELELWEGATQRRRKLLNCFDGWSVVFNTTAGTSVPTISPAPTISPVPTAAPVAPTEKPVLCLRCGGTPTTEINFNQTTQYKYGEEKYGVIGYLCNDDLEPLDEAERTVVRVQGEALVRVCVQRKPKCEEHGVFIRWIDGFSFFRDDKRQIAVEPVNKPASSGLTELHCTAGSHKCYFDTLLTAHFFTSPGTVRGVGVATLQFGGDGGSPSRRNLQAPDESVVEDTKGFELTIVATTDDFLSHYSDLYNTENEYKDVGRDKDMTGLIVVTVLVLTIVIAFLAFLGKRYYKTSEPQLPEPQKAECISDRNSGSSSCNNTTMDTRSSHVRSCESLASYSSSQRRIRDFSAMQSPQNGSQRSISSENTKSLPTLPRPPTGCARSVSFPNVSKPQEGTIRSTSFGSNSRSDRMPPSMAPPSPNKRSSSVGGESQMSRLPPMSPTTRSKRSSSGGSKQPLPSLLPMSPVKRSASTGSKSSRRIDMTGIPSPTTRTIRSPSGGRKSPHKMPPKPAVGGLKRGTSLPAIPMPPCGTKRSSSGGTKPPSSPRFPPKPSAGKGNLKRGISLPTK